MLQDVSRGGLVAYCAQIQRRLWARRERYDDEI